MFKKVLVPVDLSHEEKTAALLRAAKEMSDQNDCTLTLVNVIADVPAYVEMELPSGLAEKVSAEITGSLRASKDQFALPASTEIKVVHGNPSNEIVELADKIEADLIIIASHQPEFSDFLLGSVAAKVVRHARCSVLVLR
ncbi:MAG: universal stress protein [Rhizobiales bacterium]|nr:universal stress protein [Hyphomicrobiales bacterium]